MPVFSLYRENRLWHKGEIADKEKRKGEQKSTFKPVVGFNRHSPKKGL